MRGAGTLTAISPSSPAASSPATTASSWPQSTARCRSSASSSTGTWPGSPSTIRPCRLRRRGPRGGRDLGRGARRDPLEHRACGPRTMSRAIALIDGNGFSCSCEWVFPSNDTLYGDRPAGRNFTCSRWPVTPAWRASAVSKARPIPLISPNGPRPSFAEYANGSRRLRQIEVLARRPRTLVARMFERRAQNPAERPVSTLILNTWTEPRFRHLGGFLQNTDQTN
ncbi:hypothetical protein J2X36_004404 [Methylobacterium sp. BE186]|nr:hypothetical protein [Methylobacterium sp. BE186]